MPSRPPVASQASIQAFTRLSKPGVQKSLKTEKLYSPKSDAISLPSSTSAKRKRGTSEAALDSSGVLVDPKRRKTQLRPTSTTPQKRRSREGLPTPESTPTKPMRSQMLHSSCTTPSKRALQLVYDTPPSSPHLTSLPTSPTPHADELPEELQSLIHFHSSLVKSLSLHYAHHGNSAPIDSRLLLPSTSKIWGKRRAVLEDARRSLGVMQARSSRIGKRQLTVGLDISLSDYGRGKICFERGDSMSHYIDETEWNEAFVDELKRQWSEWVGLQHQEELTPQDIQSFIDQLPLASVTACSSMAKVKPLLAKGQRRLEDLKVGAIKAQTKVFKDLHSNSKDAAAVKSRSQGLMERLKTKELLQSALNQAESPADLSRKAALQRIKEVAPILSQATSSLASSAGQSTRRQTHSLPMLTESIQNSLRRTISKDEIEQCLRLLANQIATQFVTFIEVGRVTCVVVDPAMKPDDLDSRVEVALRA